METTLSIDAGVGSLLAFKRTLKDTLTSNWMENYFYTTVYNSWALKDSSVAAASTGKTHIVDYFLMMTESYDRNDDDDLRYVRHDVFPIKTRVCAAIPAAIKLKDTKMIMILCNFAKKYEWTIDEGSSERGGPPSPIGNLLNDAASSGCINASPQAGQYRTCNQC
jgi:hypothetical protein